MTSGMTAAEVNQAEFLFDNAERDVDVFIALYTGYVHLPET
jgi:hypothetical protein